MPPQDATLERLQELSRDVFGQVHLLTVAVVFLGTQDPLSLTEVADRVQVQSTSSIQGALKRLQAGGFIARVDGAGSDRARPYQRVGSSFWPLVEELYRRASGDGALLF